MAVGRRTRAGNHCGCHSASEVRMPTTTQDHLPLRVILKLPPAGVDFGLQKGHGNAYEVISLQRSGKGDLSFELEVELKVVTGKGGLDFKGPFVQGKTGERFFYIDI